MLVHEEKEAVECEESDHAPLIVRVGEEVQQETRVHHMRDHLRVEGDQHLLT